MLDCTTVHSGVNVAVKKSLYRICSNNRISTGKLLFLHPIPTCDTPVICRSGCNQINLSARHRCVAASLSHLLRIVSLIALSLTEDVVSSSARQLATSPKSSIYFNNWIKLRFAGISLRLGSLSVSVTAPRLTALDHDALQKAPRKHQIQIESESESYSKTRANLSWLVGKTYQVKVLGFYLCFLCGVFSSGLTLRLIFCASPARFKYPTQVEIMSAARTINIIETIVERGGTSKNISENIVMKSWLHWGKYSQQRKLIIQSKSKHFVNSLALLVFGRCLTHFMCLLCTRREPSLQCAVSFLSLVMAVLLGFLRML